MWQWHMGGMWIWWLLVAGLVVAIIWGLMRVDASRQPRDDSPEDILKRRFARGEIGREEYEHTLADLRS